MPQFILSDSINAEIKAIKLQDELTNPKHNITEKSKKYTNNRKIGFKPIITKTTNSLNSPNTQSSIVNKIPDKKPWIF